MPENETKIRRHPMAAWRRLEDRVVVVTPGNGTLFQMNETASYIWMLLEGGRGCGELAAAVAGEFDVEYEQAAADVLSFVDEMTGRQVLERL